MSVLGIWLGLLFHTGVIDSRTPSWKGICFVLSCFRAIPVTHGSSWARGLNCNCQPMPQPQQHQIWSASATRTTARCSTGSLAHWERPGFKTVSSRTLYRVLNPLSHNGNSWKWVLKNKSGSGSLGSKGGWMSLLLLPRLSSELFLGLLLPPLYWGLGYLGSFQLTNQQSTTTTTTTKRFPVW